MTREVPESGFDMSEAAAIAGLDRTYMYYLASEGKLRTFVGVTGKRKVSKFDLQLLIWEREKKYKRVTIRYRSDSSD